MKILPLHRYKVSRCNTHIILDVINVRRILLMLSLVCSAIATCALYAVGDRVVEELYSNHDGTTHLYQRNVIPKEIITLRGYIQSRVQLPAGEVERYADLVYSYAVANKMDPLLVGGLITVESGFDRYAISSVGALGLMQVMPEWHKDKIRRLRDQFGHFDIFDPEHNIALGVAILSEYKRLHKATDSALLRYNGSLHHENPTYANNVLQEFKRVKAFAPS